MSLRDLLTFFPPARLDSSVAAKIVNVIQDEYELPMHQHTTGQLVLTLRGSVTCRVERSIWLVPPKCAIWVPQNMPHCNRITANSSVILLFTPHEYVHLPSTCCTLSITPFVRELICHIASLPQKEVLTLHAERLTDVLLTELSQMSSTRLRLPISSDSRIQKIAEDIIDSPSTRRTLSDWAKYIGMSRRSLARLITQETGLSFGRWRQQLILIIAIQRLTERATVQQTAWELGYDSVTAFITMFKKAVGTSPAKYIQENTDNIK